MQPDFEHEHLLAYALCSWHHESIQFYQINIPGPSSDIKLPFLTSLPWVSALVSQKQFYFLFLNKWNQD